MINGNFHTYVDMVSMYVIVGKWEQRLFSGLSRALTIQDENM